MRTMTHEGKKWLKMLLLGGFVFIPVGLVMLFKPDWIWQLTESWKSNDGTEPSDLYVWSTRIGGALVILVGIVAIVGFFLE